MYTTIYLRGRFAPGGYDWINAYQYHKDNMGVTVWTSSDQRIAPIFFPWSSVERIG